MLSSGRSLAYAATASESNAKQRYYIAGLRSSGSTVTAVSNTVDRTAIRGYCQDANGTTISGSLKYLSSAGHYSYVNTDFMNIRRIVFRIPRESLPTSGAYMFSYSYNSDVSHEIDRVEVRVLKTANNAATGSGINLSAAEPDIINTAGEFKRTPILIDFRQVNYMYIILYLSNVSDVAGGTLSIRYEVTNDTGGTEIGYSQSAEDSANQTAENTQQIVQATQELVYSQNETNGKLDQIIQHISDQLAAMWDQIAAYLITPWMQQDRDLHDETIDTLEDLNQETNTTITNETHWHANFIIEGLKSLFIPSDSYFQTTIQDLMDWFNQKLGFLGYTLTYLIRLLNGIMNAPQNPVIRFPGIHAPNRATNEDYVLLPAMDVNLADQISLISDGSFNLLEFLRTAGDIVLVLAFIVLLQDKLHEVES